MDILCVINFFNVQILFCHVGKLSLQLETCTVGKKWLCGQYVFKDKFRKHNTVNVLMRNYYALQMKLKTKCIDLLSCTQYTNYRATQQTFCPFLLESSAMGLSLAERCLIMLVLFIQDLWLHLHISAILL